MLLRMMSYITHKEPMQVFFDSAELDPKQLILTDIKTGEEIKTIQVDFDINQCTLHMQNHKLIAVSPDGEHHVVNV